MTAPTDDARIQELCQLLAPAGGGVHLVSTGLSEQRALQRAIYGAADDDGIDSAWRDALGRLGASKVVLLGVPSDTGAGFVRGANQAPAALRRHLLEDRQHPLHDPRVVDAGDVRVVPHLLADEMLGAEQVSRARAALYGDPARGLPVAPLDQCARALTHLAALAPGAVPIVIGGDHSVGWPAFAAAHARAVAGGHRLGLLHFDAHTDLLPERLGVRICFATWAYHANELLGRDGRLVQVGIRASAHDRAHWERTLNVRQYWPEELARRGVEELVDEISARFVGLGVDRVYVSNDIDGTDAAFAAATGTPEPGGPPPAVVSGLTRGVLARFPLAGADLVEVAPPLAHEDPAEPARTLHTAASYLADLARAALESGSEGH